MNFTVAYILKALMNNITLALCRALGIICKIITEPYLDRSSDETTTALSIGNVYGRLIHVLEISSENHIYYSPTTFQGSPNQEKWAKFSPYFG
jgi:hypothetical protein